MPHPYVGVVHHVALAPRRPAAQWALLENGGAQPGSSSARSLRTGLGMSCRVVPELVVVPGCSAVPALTASVLPLLSQAEPGNKGSRHMSVQVHARVAA